MATDWLAIRDECVQVARSRGLGEASCEDVAQEAIKRVLEHQATVHDVRGYALVVSGRLAVEMRQGEEREVELGAHERVSRPEQEAQVIATQLAFSLGVRTRAGLLDLVDATGGRGRLMRWRARAVVRQALGVEVKRG